MRARTCVRRSLGGRTGRRPCIRPRIRPRRCTRRRPCRSPRRSPRIRPRRRTGIRPRRCTGIRPRRCTGIRTRGRTRIHTRIRPCGRPHIRTRGGTGIRTRRRIRTRIRPSQTHSHTHSHSRRHWHTHLQTHTPSHMHTHSRRHSRRHWQTHWHTHSQTPSQTPSQTHWHTPSQTHWHTPSQTHSQNGHVRVRTGLRGCHGDGWLTRASSRRVPEGQVEVDPAAAGRLHSLEEQLIQAKEQISSFQRQPGDGERAHPSPPICHNVHCSCAFQTPGQMRNRVAGARRVEACRHGQEVQLLFVPNIRMGKKCDRIIFGCQTGWFGYLRSPEIFTRAVRKTQKKYPVSGMPVGDSTL